MGNAVSGPRERSYDETVDFGSLTPQGIYTGPQDWNQQIVGNLIVDRKLAPFYRPLEDYEDSWDDEQILAARKELPNSSQSAHSESSQGVISPLSSKSSHGKNSNNKSGKEPLRPSEASVYRNAVECPICFLYYPPNINHSRCCDQAICTECFVQIKRAEPTTTHLVSEPAACPYCVQENFGVTYQPPEWRTGLVREGHVSPPSPSRSELKIRPPPQSEKSRRRKSFGADDPEVVTIDQIRPDWEAKLAAVRAAVQRRANRRIIMRQVGDRLIPVGITSGRIVNIEPPEGGGGDNEGSSRRRRRLHPGAEFGQIMGQDIEELMLMEAMRLSALEYEEQQRRQNTANNAANTDTNTDTNTNTVTNVNDNGTETPAENSNTSSSAPSNNTSTGNVITPSSSPNASPRNSLSPPNESGRSLSSSPRQSFNRMPSPLGASSEPGLRRSTSSGSRSAIVAALAAHTASAILGSDEDSRSDPLRPTEPVELTESMTTVLQIEIAGNPPQTVNAGATEEGVISSIATQASASPEVRIDPPLSPVRTENVPSPPLPPPPSEGSSIAADTSDSPMVPPLPERTISADDAAAERMPEGYVPLPSTTDLSAPLLKH